MRGRPLEEQDGFTLPEMMVTMMVMISIFFALYSIFDTSIRIFRFGNDKVEAVENARLGLERMEREIRAAYPVNGPASASPDRYRFFEANGVATSPPPAIPQGDQITFGNELNNPAQPSGNEEIDCNPSGAAPGDPAYTPCEYVTYKLSSEDPANPSAPRTLQRVNTANSADAGEPVVEFVRPPVAGDPNQYGLRFRYFAGTTCEDTINVGDEVDPDSPGACEQEDISRVEIALQITKDDGTQTLTTDVTLRNRGILPTSTSPSPPPPPPDTTPPETTITSGPSGSLTSTSASFDFESSEDPSSFECRLDGGAWSACTSPQGYTGLTPRAYTFEVRATDAAGNTDPTPASRTWTVVSPNTPPNANDDGPISVRNTGPAAGRRANITVLANDTDPEGDTLTVQSFTQPSRGTVTRNPDGTLRYESDGGGAGRGPFTFTYTITDGRGGTDTATVRITVTS